MVRSRCPYKVMSEESSLTFKQYVRETVGLTALVGLKVYSNIKSHRIHTHTHRD